MPERAPRTELCPRCEQGILTSRLAPHSFSVSGTKIHIPNVQVEECHHCGFHALSGRDAQWFELFFAAPYASVGELISALRAAGCRSLFLTEHTSECRLSFGSRDYIASLTDELRALYLDNESAHVIQELNAFSSHSAPLEFAGRRCTLKLPKLGEGENGVVYAYYEADETVLKLAKPRTYSREHLKEEHRVTCIFEQKGIPVPRVLDIDPFGSYMLKERLAGESLSRIYPTLGAPRTRKHQMVRAAVAEFITALFTIFTTYPEAKTSVSPNNIFVILTGSTCRCLLVDTGPAPFHDYSAFDFSHYWEVLIPQKITQYRAVGYL